MMTRGRRLFTIVRSDLSYDYKHYSTNLYETFGMDRCGTLECFEKMSHVVNAKFYIIYLCLLFLPAVWFINYINECF